MDPVDCGHFDPDAREYVITEPKTPRPWHNYLANEVYLVNLTQLGTGAAFSQPPGEGLRANLVEDREGTGGPRFVFLRDRDDGFAWSLTGAPHCPAMDAWCCRVGQGYQVMESTLEGVAASWRVMVPPGMDRCELWTITVRNEGPKPRRLSVFPYTEMHLTGGSTLMDFVSVLGGRYSAEDRAVFGINTCRAFPGYFKALMAGSREPDGWTVSKDEFVGHYNDYRDPIAVARGDVRNSQAGTEWLGASLRWDVDLAPDRSWSVDVLVGIMDDEADGRRLIARYLGDGAVAGVADELERISDERCSRTTTATGDAQADRWLNTWLKRQLEIVTDWGRVIGRGYRDMLQDSYAHRLVDPAKARIRMLETFSKQFADGRCIRAWRLPNAELDTQDYADSPSWMAPALCMYVRETGDLAVLDEAVPYLAEDPDAPSTENGTAWEHVLKAQRHLLQDRGRHGLCRIRFGDWSDTMNGVGARGEGVSVMLSMQVVWGCRQLAELAERVGQPEVAAEMRAGADELAAAINAEAWDGAGWYVRAFDDDDVVVGGTAIPASDGGEQVIFLNPQSWSLISGVAPADRAAAAIASAEARLETGYGKTLNAPQSTFFKERLGHMSAQTPGFYENGSVYTHGNAFWAAGLAMSGRGDQAWEAMRKVLPDTPGRENGDGEPFTVPNMYIGPVVERRKQRNLYLSGWRTGSAAWLYLVGIEYLLGLRADYDGLRISPALPEAWKDANAVRDFRGARYEVRYRGHGSKIVKLTLDGVEREDPVLPPPELGRTYRVEVELAAK